MTTKSITVSIFLLAIIGGATFFYFRDQQARPNNNPNEHSQASAFSAYNEKISIIEPIILSGRPISTTGDTRHSVPLSELKTLGASKDQTPIIDNPKFVSMANAEEFLENGEPGIALQVGDIARFYPLQILVWHELVADKIAGESVLVTYCPLCASGMVYRSSVGGQPVEFGSSGQLWQASPVMYDKATESYWSQILGEAIVGQEAGKVLGAIPSDIMTFAAFKNAFPSGQVLSQDTGNTRLYGESPYGDYFSVSDLVDDLIEFKDARLPKEEMVLGIFANGQPKAYSITKVKDQGSIEDELGDSKVILEYDDHLDVVRAYVEGSSGNRARISAFTGFWLGWVGAHPDTQVF